MRYQNILLIDDDIDDQEIFTTALEEVSPSLQCTALSDAKTALEKLETNELRPDVIFLDLNMPIMSGQQFLTEIKKRDQLQEIPVIIFSTSSNLSTIAHTKALGAAHFVTKPGSFAALVELLKPLIALA
jgi:CheY-like chemotaxis protein